MDGLIRLWEHRNKGSHCWFIWFLIPGLLKRKMSKVCLKHLHYFHIWSCSLPSKYKANFCRIPCNQRYKMSQLQTTSRILFGVHWPHQLWCQCLSHIHQMYRFYSVMRWMVEGPPIYHWNPCEWWWLQINLQIKLGWEKGYLLLCCWMMCPWNLPYQS